MNHFSPTPTRAVGAQYIAFYLDLTRLGWKASIRHGRIFVLLTRRVIIGVCVVGRRRRRGHGLGSDGPGRRVVGFARVALAPVRLLLLLLLAIHHGLLVRLLGVRGRGRSSSSWSSQALAVAAVAHQDEV